MVGTHALFQESVAFRDLGLAVVDEQHRFGVHQRLALGAKGEAVDILVMTATPIPRTLALTFFGDMDVSVLDEKPPGRQPIATRARLRPTASTRSSPALGRALAAGRAGLLGLPAGRGIRDRRPRRGRGALRRPAPATSATASAWSTARCRGRRRTPPWSASPPATPGILVATTVVEVGVDVPEATIMVIEHAERFGLAQLHQLRGRVGRGAKASTCLLLYAGRSARSPGRGSR